MDINTQDGSINKFISMEYTAQSSTVTPVFTTQGALYYDKNDGLDGQEYIYEAFLMDDKIEMIRLLVSTTTPVIDWSYEFYDFTEDEASASDRRKDPAFIHMDPNDNTVFYLSGRYQGRASVMKFFKRTGKMIWWNKFSLLSNIRAIEPIKTDSIFYGCGDYWSNEDVSGVDDMATEASYEAGIFKMQNDGAVKWYRKIAGTNPIRNEPNQDRCYGLSVDQSTGYVTSLLQVKAKEIRSSSLSRGDFYDTVLLRLQPSGSIDIAVQITNRDSSISMYAASNALFQHDDYFYFGGWSAGFHT